MTDTPPTPDATPHTYAAITDGTVTNVLVADATYAASQGWVGPLDALVPTPGIGWAYDASTQTWIAPTPSAPSEQQTAQATVSTLASQIPAYQAQIAADTATLAAMTPADLTTQQALDIHQRVVAGLGVIVEGLGALVQASGQ